MKDIMIATGNKNKTKEYRQILEPLGYCVHDLSEIEHQEIEETGSTFQENAILKAKAVKTNMMVIADDSGLEIHGLNNEPGIYSARYLQGYDYDYKCHNIIDRLKNIKDRSARFTCCIALVENDDVKTFTGTMDGTIAYQMKGNNGFGYDPIFIAEGNNITNGELTNQQKNEISHRGKATKLLLAYLGGKNK